MAQYQSDVEAKLVEISSRADKALEDMATRVGKSLESVSQVVNQVWSNQQELQKSAISFDTQFCVLTRSYIVRMNDMVDSFNKAMKALKEHDEEGALFDVVPVERVTYESINELFLDFEMFRKHPSFREHFREWYTGDDVSHIIDEVKEQEEERRAVAEAIAAGKAAAEGDEDGGSTEGSSDVGEEGCNEVPEVPDADAASVAPEDGESCDEVPEVRDDVPDEEVLAKEEGAEAPPPPA